MRVTAGQAATIASAIFSAVISVGKFVLAHGTTGKIDASTARSPCTPLTRPCVSTTVIGSSARPMRHEHDACHTPIAALRTKVPHIDLDTFAKDPKVENIKDMFTVQMLCNFVKNKLA